MHRIFNKSVMLIALLVLLVISGCNGSNAIQPGDDVTPPAWNKMRGRAL